MSWMAYYVEESMRANQAEFERRAARQRLNEPAPLPGNGRRRWVRRRGRVLGRRPEVTCRRAAAVSGGC